MCTAATHIVAYPIVAVLSRRISYQQGMSRIGELRRGSGVEETCKVLGHSGVNGAGPVRHSVVLGNLGEEGGVVALGTYEGQMSCAAGRASRQAVTGTSQVHCILCHAPICCPLSTCNTTPL